MQYLYGAFHLSIKSKTKANADSADSELIGTNWID